MRRILLVTAREYRRMVALPAFWMVALIVPVLVILVPLVQRSFGRLRTAGYVLVDQSGRYRAQIARRVELDYQRQVLLQLLAFAEEWRTPGAAPLNVQPSLQAGDTSIDSLVETFAAAGGATAALRGLKPRLLPDAPPFQPPPRPLVELPLPPDIDTTTADRFGAAIGPWFQKSIGTSPGTEPLDIAVYIPADVDSGGQARVWTSSAAGAALVQDLKLELTGSARLKALQAAGVDPLSAARIETLRAPVAVAPPETHAVGAPALAHSGLPLALAYLLLISMMITGSMMLQGLVEERANKLLEAVLACVSPRELMTGKLIGISALGLSIVTIWVLATVVVVRLNPSSPLGFVIPALASLAQTPGIAVAMVFYFLAGFMTTGMIFLAIALVRDSMQEAQAYLMPVALFISVPSMLLASVISRDPNGLLPRIFSWIPVYTPLVMLARLESGVSSVDLFGTAAVLVLFAALELFVLARLFETNLIQTSRGFHIPVSRRRILALALAVTVAGVAITVRRSRARVQPADQSVAQRSGVESAPVTDPQPCRDPGTFSITPGSWSGWSIDPRNSRFQPEPGLSLDQIPRLKVKWTFAYPGGNYGQPTVVGDRVFLTSLGGAIYSLDARTGCRYWRFAQSTPSRTTISIGPLPGGARSGYAAYFGDNAANVYAVDAASGELLWKTRVDSHPHAVLTGSPVLFRDRLYVPVSSSEEATSNLAAYSCCTFRGSVAALDAATGKRVWKAYSIDRPAAPTKKNSAGTQMYGPAGAAVWSAPAIDAKRNRLYFTTGNSYTDAQEDGSDAVVAVDLATGHVIWRRQVTQNDDDLSGCTSGRKLVNCPSTRGHDYDFGASPILLPLPDGRDILAAGQKSGAVFGIDPESGAVLWRNQVGAGGVLGGILWGMGADNRYLYVANADVNVAGNGRPRSLCLNPGDRQRHLVCPRAKSPLQMGAWRALFQRAVRRALRDPRRRLRRNHRRPRTRLRRSRRPRPLGFRHRSPDRRRHRRQLRFSRQWHALPHLRLPRRPRRKLRQRPARLFRRRPLIEKCELSFICVQLRLTNPRSRIPENLFHRRYSNLRSLLTTLPPQAT